MKEIKAIIQPFMVSKVIEALEAKSRMPGVTISTVQGYGHKHVLENEAESKELGVGTLPKVKLEIVVSNSIANDVVKIIQENAHTGNYGDGKIFIYNVLDAVDIRTNKSGRNVI